MFPCADFRFRFFFLSLPFARPSRNPCLLPALNEFHRQVSDLDKHKHEISAMVINYSDFRIDIRREILGIARTYAAADAEAARRSSSAGDYMNLHKAPCYLLHASSRLNECAS